VPAGESVEAILSTWVGDLVVSHGLCVIRRLCDKISAVLVNDNYNRN